MDSVTWYKLPDVDDYYVSVLPACFHETGGLVFFLWLILCDWRFFLKVFLANP